MSSCACGPLPVLTFTNGSHPVRYSLDCPAVSSKSESCHPSNCSGPSTVPLSLLHRRPLPTPAYNGCYPLPPAALRRSLVFSGDAHFRRVIHRARSGMEVRVAVVGGSVAKADYAASDGGSAHVRFIEWLRKRYAPGHHIKTVLLARAGTTSQWALANFEEVARAAPHLILWDYSSNDLITPPGVVPGASAAQSRTMGSPHFNRAAADALARRMLQIPTAPAVLFLMLMRGFNASQFHFQADVFEPVARAYGLPFVSYRDAVWPSKHNIPSETTHLFDCGVTIHPRWYVLQLIADCMAYAWAAVEAGMGPRYQPNMDLLPPLPGAAYHDPAINDIEACPFGWRTHLDAKRGQASFPATGRLEERFGWRFRSDLQTKQGWEFDGVGTRSGSAAGFVQRAGAWLRGIATRWRPPSAAAATEGRWRLLEPISFEVDLRERVVVSFLRSYAHFGRALLWVNGGRDAALSKWRAQRAFVTRCEASSKQRGSTHLQYSGSCSLHRSGMLPMPHELDGHWDDHSSQTVAVGFRRGYSLFTDRFVTGSPLDVYHVDVNEPFVPRPGRYNVSIAMLWNDAENSKDASVTQTRFKILSVKSC
jgi:hypothetical protein